MKFYLNQYFSQTSSHEIVRRNVKLTRENLNLGSKIKHLSPVYRKRHRKAAQTTAKLVSSESKNEPNYDLTLSPDLFFWASSTWCRQPKYFPYVHIYKSGIVGFKNRGDVCYILAMFRRGRSVNVDAKRRHFV